MPSSSDAEKGTAESPKEADANSKQQQVHRINKKSFGLWLEMRFQL